jgi:mannitol/fructose-specific phosphotransferase system IIA component (Ntr-type)
MGLCPKGIDFDAPDGEPVRAIIMIATPEGYEGRHLEVMAAVAGLMRDDDVRAHLLTARSSAEIFEIIEDGSKQDYNYFVED